MTTPAPAPAEFITTTASDRVRSNRLTLVEVAGQRVLLTRVQGELCAFDALCPHQLGNLARGAIYKGEIECPIHGWRFAIRSGDSVYPEEESLRLRRYEAKEENGVVKVKLP